MELQTAQFKRMANLDSANRITQPSGEINLSGVINSYFLRYKLASILGQLIILVAKKNILKFFLNKLNFSSIRRQYSDILIVQSGNIHRF